MDGKKILAIAAVPAVMAIGALGFTSQQGTAQPNSAATQAQTVQQAATKSDPDNIQQGDQTSPDKPGQAGEQEAKGPDKDNVQQGAGNQVQDGKPDVPGAIEGAGK